MTREENALTLVIEAHSLVADGLKQYDDLERMAIDEREMRAVQERSKKETRMDRKVGNKGRMVLTVQQQYDLLMVGENEGQASSSRSPSPAHTSVPLPDESGRSSPMHSTRPGSAANQHLASLTDDRGMSRTPSPDGRRRLVHPQPIIAGGAVGGAPPPVPPKKMSSPTRTDSPLGRRIPGPRPLPNPFRSGNSHQNLTNHAAVQAAQEPMNGADSSTDEEEEIEVRPSRKALGKRRAEPDSELQQAILGTCGLTCADDFDPDDMFKTDKVDAMSIHSITADDIYLDKRTVYAYDAWAENEVARKEKALAPSSPMSVSPTNPSAKDVSAAHANGTTGYTAAADAVAAR
jgi:hypothetical protein